MKERVSNDMIKEIERMRKHERTRQRDKNRTSNRKRI